MAKRIRTLIWVSVLFFCPIFSLTAHPSCYQSLTEELRYDTLEVTGTIPAWLNGTLVQTGPGLFDIGDKTVNHWFDGLALLRRFTIDNGTVSFAARFLESDAYSYSLKANAPYFAGFATDPDRSYLGKLFSIFTNDAYDNAAVAIVDIGGKIAATTEVPQPIEFDLITLDTIGVITFDDSLHGHVCCPHPHIDRVTGETYGLLIEYKPPSTYQFYKQKPDSLTRELITSIPVDRPSFMHSFAMTDRYLILTHTPLTVSPLSLLNRTTPFSSHLKWQPDDGTTFIVIDRHSGETVGVFESEAFYTYHHINAFDHQGTIVLDVVTYDDPTLLEAFALDNLRSHEKSVAFPKSKIKRFTIDLDNEEIAVHIVADCSLDMPCINPEKRQRPHRYVYGIGMSPAVFGESVLKVDLTTGESISWNRDGCYCGEPLFIARPGGVDEDDGVLLVIVSDVTEECTRLVILDARDLNEKGCAVLPHILPYGLHGKFYSKGD